MSKVILDTNILYHASGLVNDKRVNYTALKQLLQNNELFLNSVSLGEIINKNKNSKSNIEKIISPLLDYNLKIINNSNFSIKHTPITYYKNISCFEINNDFDELLSMKIDAESSSANLLFLNTVLLIYFYIIQESDYNNNHQILNSVLSTFIQMQSSMLQEWYNSFKECLVQAYKNDDKIDKQFKYCFNIQLYVSLKFMLEILYEFNDKDEYDFILPKTFFTRVEKLNKNKDNVLQFIKNQTKNKQQFFNDFKINLLDKYWETEASIGPIQSSHINYYLEKTFIIGRKIKKNDTNDMLICSTLDKINDSKLLTFDKDMIDFLSQISHPSMSLISNIKI